MHDYSCIVQTAEFTATYYTILVQNSIFPLKLVQDIYKVHVLKSYLTHDYEIPLRGAFGFPLYGEATYDIGLW